MFGPAQNLALLTERAIERIVYADHDAVRTKDLQVLPQHAMAKDAAGRGIDVPP